MNVSETSKCLDSLYCYLRRKNQPRIAFTVEAVPFFAPAREHLAKSRLENAICAISGVVARTRGIEMIRRRHRPCVGRTERIYGTSLLEWSVSQITRSTDGYIVKTQGKRAAKNLLMLLKPRNSE